ncbi:phosphotransferase family protein [Nocardioides jishulii]|uniref:Phosphotransferase family protein n=1 Tax=Nocardioides jishulii TaxID=2575440 RepID=A0A4V5TL30_9ACTN|nr:phosphotransferase family protein [Nocardioides jishulii]QCX28384.1 phosphotransferase family protein [Nocardioides jishulii]TKI64723.1 phosphotransferase family protein [Nocardioides jishulii]
MSDSLPGLDLDAFASWFGPHRPDAGPDWSAELIAGGKSNLTYRVGDGRDTWIVRRPPLGHVQATAHDMAREFTVMSALAGTAVPVPGTIALCEDESVLGARFYVMELVEGTPFRDAEQLSTLGEETTARLADSMIDVLAALHAVDPDEVGLADFGRPQGFLTRQVRRWGMQMAGSRTRDLPDADRLLAHLSDHVPDDGGTPAIVHGDYRLDNLLVVPSDADPVKAVVDWEMSTLGDPLTDLALLLVYDRVAALVPGLGVSDASGAPGYPTSEELLTRYAAARGLDVGALSGAMEFHLGLAHYKLAAILEGIHHRFVAGQTVGGGFDHIGDAVEPLLAAGLRAATGRD